MIRPQPKCGKVRQRFWQCGIGQQQNQPKGKKSIFVMTHGKLRALPKDEVITYAKVVVEQHLQKEDLNCV
jgi:hypothetical protein